MGRIADLLKKIRSFLVEGGPHHEWCYTEIARVVSPNGKLDAVLVDEGSANPKLMLAKAGTPPRPFPYVVVFIHAVMVGDPLVRWLGDDQVFVAVTCDEVSEGESMRSLIRDSSGVTLRV